MFSILFYSKLLASVVLFIFGLRILSFNLLEVFEIPLFRLFRDPKGSTPKAMLKGLSLGAPSLEGHKLISSVGGMVQAGLLSQRHALVVTTFGQIFSLFGLILALFVPMEKGIVMLGLGFLPLILARGKWEEVFRNLAFVLIGIGLISLASGLLNEGILILQSHQELISSFNSSFILSVVTGIILSFLTLLVLEKDTILLVIFFKLGLLFPNENLIFLVALAIPILGSSLGYWPLANKSNIYGKRFFKVLILFEVVLIALVIPALIRYPEIFYSPVRFLLLVLSLRVTKFVLLLIFQPILNRVSLKLFPQQGHRENFQLGVLGDSRHLSPPLALIQAGFHLAKLQSVILRMFDLVHSYATDNYHARNLAKIKDYERIIDNMQVEIQSYLRGVSEKELTSHQAYTLQKLVLQSQELESISDYIDKVASYLTAFLESGESLDSLKESTFSYYLDVSKFYSQVTVNLPLNVMDEKEVIEMSKKIKSHGNDLRHSLGELVETHRIGASGLLVLSDLFNAIKKIRSHSLKLYNNLL
ncbi:MAG: hypothetical protein GY909_02815 [Oligoflexia bacterium]|nr:hypothetical protein [Oligoflexia bacterium]